jgi:hypothetical protein
LQGGEVVRAGDQEEVGEVEDERPRYRDEELVVVRLGEPPDHIVIESWHAGRGVTRRERP